MNSFDKLCAIALVVIATALVAIKLGSVAALVATLVLVYLITEATE